MGLFDFLFSSSTIVTCDQCGAEIPGEPIVHNDRDYCVACNRARLEAIEVQRRAEEAAMERLVARQRFPNRD